MRNSVVVAVVMFVTFMFLSSFATAADLSPFEGSRQTVVAWGESFPDAQWHAEQQVTAIGNATGKTPKVQQRRMGREDQHDPPYWYEINFYLEGIGPSALND